LCVSCYCYRCYCYCCCFYYYSPDISLPRIFSSPSLTAVSTAVSFSLTFSSEDRRKEGLFSVFRILDWAVLITWKKG
jgi:hypothetical protein